MAPGGGPAGPAGPVLSAAPDTRGIGLRENLEETIVFTIKYAYYMVNIWLLYGYYMVVTLFIMVYNGL